MFIMWRFSNQQIQKLITVFLICLLAGCSLSLEPDSTPVMPAATAESVPTITVTEDMSPSPTPTPEGLYQPMSLPEGLRDELPVMQGICYEAARDAAGRTFVLRNAIDHVRFYDEADQSKLCRRPVTREPFDFDSGRVLAGFWQVGQGCTAHHEVTAVNRDEASKTITLHVRFVTEGTCPYELVRPFWVSIPDAAGWEIVFDEG